ncbi:glycosyltransferase [Algoriphagus sp. PAP.12]|uniref:glycosyltransferase n=1 Tax=Algoriphagus sp. PAP.12 TaxID=2996678 RepID=UPI00227D3AB0|nr:glycosyltransferase [Algoriphagus sp. PAP.12]
MRFGGFIITYNRPKILLKTIDAIFTQSHPPELIWIIDNSDNLETDQALAGLLDSRIHYYRMGYNSGPAGAAAKGLQLCADEGFDWIYWGDDNDPPFRNDCFERLLAIRDQNPFTGVLGSVGQFFDRKNGVIKRVQSRLLEKKETLEVDYVGGGMCMLVSGQIAREGVCPDPGLFFGFEELDFCLKVCRKGYVIIVDCKLFLEARKIYHRTNFDRPYYQKKLNLNREYYSLRNLLFIADTLTLPSMKYKLVQKWSLKSIYGFRYGISYGFTNFKLIMLAFIHFSKGIKGKTIEL